VSEIVCDYLNVTVPLEDSGGLADELRLYLASLGAVVSQVGLWSLGGGTVKLGERGRVLTLGLSGAALQELRGTGALPEFLSIIADWPHRITRLDAALDLYGRDAPSLLRQVYDQARAGKHRLTRKAISPGSVRCVFGPDDQGAETGTVYLGKRTAEVYAKVYDKRWERMCRGNPDPGPWVRYELTVTGKTGVTLRDVVEPAGVFWHHMGKSLLDCPPGGTIHQWKGHAEGFHLPPRPETLPYQALVRRLEDNAELRELVWLAVQAGDLGARRLVQEVQNLAQSEVQDAGLVPSSDPSCQTLKGPVS